MYVLTYQTQSVEVISLFLVSIQKLQFTENCYKIDLHLLRKILTTRQIDTVS